MNELKSIYDNAKSFYKKAFIKREDNKIKLYSYKTLVCTILNNNRYQLNYNIDSELLFSNTTLRHIKEFLKQYLYLSNDITKNDIIKNNNKELK